jgi:hypothetical protein
MKKNRKNGDEHGGFNLNSMLLLLVALISVGGTLVSIAAGVLGMFISVGAGFMWAGTTNTRLDAQREYNTTTTAAIADVRKAQQELARDLDAWEKWQLSEQTQKPTPPRHRKEEN